MKISHSSILSLGILKIYPALHCASSRGLDCIVKNGKRSYRDILRSFAKPVLLLYSVITAAIGALAPVEII
jgi:hypothetical protein